MKTLIILALLLLPVVAFAEPEKPQEKQQVCAERIVVARMSNALKQCIDECAVSYGACSSHCDTEDCLSGCNAAEGYCISRCKRR